MHEFVRSNPNPNPNPNPKPKPNPNPDPNPNPNPKIQRGPELILALTLKWRYNGTNFKKVFNWRYNGTNFEVFIGVITVL